MDRQERKRVRQAAREVAAWVEQARRVRAWRHATEESVRRHVAVLRQRAVPAARAGATTWRVVPLTRLDIEGLLGVLAARANLPPTVENESTLLLGMTDRPPRALKAVKSLFTWRRLFAREEQRTTAETEATYLLGLHEWGVDEEISYVLDQLGRPTGAVDASRLTFDDLLDPSLRLAEDLRELGTSPALLDQTRFGELPRAIADLEGAVAEEQELRQAVLDAASRLRAPVVRQTLADLRLEDLRQSDPDSWPSRALGPLLTAGFTTVHDVLDRRRHLRSLDGIGSKLARVTIESAERVRRFTEADTPIRLDPNDRTPEATALVRALAAWDAGRRTRGAADAITLAAGLKPLAASLTDDVVKAIVLCARDRPTHELDKAIDTVIRHADHLFGGGRGGRPAGGGRGGRPATGGGRGRRPATVTRPEPPTDPWTDFRSRPADYYAMLAELGVLTEDEEKTYGDLPPGLVETVQATLLRTEHLNVTLRGYQSFAARFALVQRKVVIGDEMGLGKTIEALAVLAHLWAAGAQHFLVVCPPGVLTNWIREVEGKSELEAHRIHGDGWRDAAEEWARQGGVAVTTYDTTWMGERRWARGPELACVVVDEAQYVKNPSTQRAQRVAGLLTRVERALLLTGTPMENHVGEFQTLIRYLRPDLLDGHPVSPAMPPRLFRRLIAPAYIRRNQEDVLPELPELVEVEEWLPMGARDLASYKAAVAAGNLMQMRQAAMLHGPESPKAARLLELVEEAEDNGRRVVVYSYFREVLERIVSLLPAPVFGPLDGSVPAAQRQRIIDDFSAAPHGAVLVAQITTGGIGLNIQAASVVILCEPQLNPAREDQAIARAHRMGQFQSVQVHRLLTEDAVDERIVELLAEKRRLFDDYARVSTTAEAAPEAIQKEELTEAEVGRRVLDAERTRLLYEPPVASAPDV